MRILHAIHSLNPAHGGTTYGLRGLVDTLLEAGHPTEILVLDDAASPWLEDWPCAVHAAGRGLGNYGWNPAFRRLAHRLTPQFDRVLVHGLWQFHGLTMRRVCLAAGVPYAVFPHGMLDRWVAGAYRGKNLLKQVYWRLIERHVLRDAGAVFFTTEAELEAARETFQPFQVRPLIAPFGIQPPPGSLAEYRRRHVERFPHLAGRRVLTFLGRLHPKKGCDLLIEGYAPFLAAAGEGSQAWHLRLVGPHEDGPFVRELERSAARHGLVESGALSFAGAVEGESKWQELAGAEALILPSHQENFGVVLAEAMACNTPVLISDKVNGWEPIVAAGAGLAAPDTAAGVVSLLTRWKNLPAADREAMRVAARAYFDRAMSAAVSAEAVLAGLTALEQPGQANGRRRMEP